MSSSGTAKILETEHKLLLCNKLNDKLQMVHCTFLLGKAHQNTFWCTCWWTTWEKTTMNYHDNDHENTAIQKYNSITFLLIFNIFPQVLWYSEDNIWSSLRWWYFQVSILYLLDYIKTKRRMIGRTSSVSLQFRTISQSIFLFVEE